MAKSLLLVIVVILMSNFGVDAQTTRPQPRRIGKDNMWEFENFRMQRWSHSNPSHVTAKFQLYRSHFRNCTKTTSLSDALSMFFRGPCSMWVIPETGVQCDSGYQEVGSKFFKEVRPGTNSSWATCDTNLEAVEGTENIPEKHRKWIKWRITEWKENGPEGIPPAKGETIGFADGKLEILNGVPIDSSPITQVKVYRAVHGLGDVDCGPTESESKGLIRYGCGYTRRLDRIDCPVYGDGMCATRMNVTETIESLSDWNSRFK